MVVQICKGINSYRPWFYHQLQSKILICDESDLLAISVILRTYLEK